MRKTLWASAIAATVLVSAAYVGGCGETAAPPANDGKPLIVAHRGGTADMPENTVAAIETALSNHADALWLTIQASSDGQAVLYRPQDLSAQTDGSGPVAAKTAEELTRLNAGYNFADASGGHPYRDRPTPIPTLREALAVIPGSVPIFLDLKQLPAGPVVSATAATLRDTGNLDRVTIYSTSAEVTDAATAQGLHVAESREQTRKRLLDVALGHVCGVPAVAPGVWVALEKRLKVTVSEKVTLGSAGTDTEAALWDRESVDCLRSGATPKLMVIGINSKSDYDAVKSLGADAVLVDSPAAAKTWR
ncbi:glycerophosphodiester phosphodiesterase family protein [Nocardia arthritidis]|uniref:Glycerophosphodiester phosphodiesterase n=1 Tax=Nocardia arthritidis TaxID=228602 RepID=A0A6G9YLF6_9NOCA|nr:glycerophosphodiester phosphodiesterase family protein [Nocardia arthritidis]QIS14042.1 glycerophosphodiester phosphodiesterase [Nocardia arthritidis]